MSYLFMKMQIRKLGAYTLLELAASEGKNDIIDVLMANNAVINQGSKDKMHILYIAFNFGHIETTRVLINYGADVNTTDSIGRTLLHHAAIEGDLDSTMFLVARGANVNVKSLQGTPLEVCHDEEIKGLLRGRASIDKENSKPLKSTKHIPLDPWAIKLNQSMIKRCKWYGADSASWEYWYHLLEACFERADCKTTMILYGTDSQKLHNRELTLKKGEGTLYELLNLISEPLNMRFDFHEGVIVFRDRQNPLSFMPVSDLQTQHLLKQKFTRKTYIPEWLCAHIEVHARFFGERNNIEIKLAENIKTLFIPELGRIYDINPMGSFNAFEWTCRVYGVKYKIINNEIFLYDSGIKRDVKIYIPKEGDDDIGLDD